MKYLVLCAAALSFLVPAMPVLAQSADTTATMTTCSDVIKREYDGDQTRRNDCVNAVTAFLKGLGAPAPGVDPTISDLVVKLTDLYKEDPDCMIKDTELPDAIRAAAALLSDDTLRADLLAIADQIAGCTFDSTAALGDEEASP